VLSTGLGALVGGTAVGDGAAVVCTGEADPAKPGDDDACPAVFVGAGAGVDESHDADGDADEDADEPDAADDETAPAGVAAPPDGPYPVDVPGGANELPASSMTPSTAPVSSVIVGVSSFTSACTASASAEVQRRR